MKKCRICKKFKPFREFHKNRQSRKDGLEWFCKKCSIKRMAEWRNKNPNNVRAINKRSKDKCRLEVLIAYGKKCRCCGEKTIEFLGIDHVNNDGNKERKKLKMNGSRFYSYLRKMKFPKGRYQVLCHNCNLSKGFYGRCPHKSSQIK